MGIVKDLAIKGTYTIQTHDEAVLFPVGQEGPVPDDFRLVMSIKCIKFLQ